LSGSTDSLLRGQRSFAPRERSCPYSAPVGDFVHFRPHSGQRNSPASSGISSRSAPFIPIPPLRRSSSREGFFDRPDSDRASSARIRERSFSVGCSDRKSSDSDIAVPRERRRRESRVSLLEELRTGRADVDGSEVGMFSGALSSRVTAAHATLRSESAVGSKIVVLLFSSRV